MFAVLGCLTTQHNYWLVGLAAVACAFGSVVSLQLLGKLQIADGARRLMHLALAGIIGGATIWTTHFVAMVAYDPGISHAYEPVLTAVSMFVAIVGVTTAFAVASYSRRAHFIEFGGVLYGLSVAAMHYVGMAAYQIPGRFTWDWTLVVVSVAFGAGLGALALNRSLRAGRSRLRSWSGVGVMVLAICTMHFTAMGAASIELDPTIAVPPQLIPDATLGVIVFAVMSLFLVAGLAAFIIESKIEQQAASAFRHLSLHDTLTELPNRAYLRETLTELKRAFDECEDGRLAMLTIDLDRFKEINDIHGHTAGDTVLTEIAERIRGALGENEFVARNGGDEFLALKWDYGLKAEVIGFAERLRGLITEPIDCGGANFMVGASIGVALYPDHSKDVDQLIGQSDLAMYRAKESVAQKICLFDSKMDAQSRERLELAYDLKQALHEGQFELNYQLQNDIATREPVGFEALLRWNHPQRGRVSPGEFIPLAEKSGLIREIGAWVLRQACAEAAGWTRQYRIAVNVAPQQLAQPSFVEMVRDVLIETGLAPERLELEVTEASIIEDQEKTIEVMRRLKALGVRIAMDDFGTGYSSLATLQAFPFDKIKIDRSFVDQVDANEQSAAIVRSTLLLGAALKIPVLAEGVENEPQMSFLSRERCAEVQGFLFGRPMSTVDMRRIAMAEDAHGEEEALLRAVG